MIRVTVPIEVDRQKSILHYDLLDGSGGYWEIVPKVGPDPRTAGFDSLGITCLLATRK